MNFLTPKLSNDQEVIDHREKWGKFNDFPEGWIDVSDDAKKVALIMDKQISGSIKVIESRQMYPPHKKGDAWGKMTQATLYFTYGGDNFAVGREYASGGWIFKYYQFGCQHNNQTSTKLGNCYYRHTCKDCGISWNIDSGD